MIELAKYPIGKTTAPNTGAVAQWITTLKRRTTLVSVGDKAGVIMTYDTPKPLTGALLAARVADIQARTHAKYCRPRPDPPSPADVVVDETPPNYDGDLTVLVPRSARRRAHRETLPLSGWADLEES